MSVSYLVPVDPSWPPDDEPIVGRFPMPLDEEGTPYPLEVAGSDEVGTPQHGRKLQALVDGARRLVTCDPAWALWAIECAVDIEFLHDEHTAMSCMAAGLDRLYFGERRAPELVAPEHVVAIDRRRLDAALGYIGHKGSPVFRARIADAYDSLVPALVA